MEQSPAEREQVEEAVRQTVSDRREEIRQEENRDSREDMRSVPSRRNSRDEARIEARELRRDVKEEKPESVRKSISSRRPSTLIEFDLDMISKDSPTTTPILFKSKATPSKPLAPAIKIDTPQTVYIYPLSRIDLGEVWKDAEEIAKLEISILPGGWHSALEAFQYFVDYSESYLFALLSVLRSQKFMNHQEFKPEDWKRACKGEDGMIKIQARCPLCTEIRCLSMRTFYTSSTRRKKLNYTCSELGFTCHLKDAKMVETLVTTSSATSTTEQQEEYERFDRIGEERTTRPERSTCQALVPYKPPRQELPTVEEYVTWSQAFPSSSVPNQAGMTSTYQQFDPYDAIQAAPDYFITGHALVKFNAPDPTLKEINEYKEFQKTSQWRDLFRDFTKWSDLHKDAQYDGEEDITAVFRWTTALKTRFLNPRIINSVIRAELAATTFTKRASAWWLAHRTRAPNLLLTFEQLIEMIKRELVPRSSTSDAVHAWSELSFKGDVNKYIKDLEQLINHFPLRRESIIIMATKPLGEDIQRRIHLMDMQYGPAGLSISQLKQAITDFLSLHQSSRSYYSRERDRSVTIAPRPLRPYNQPQQFIRRENLPQQHLRRENPPPYPRRENPPQQYPRRENPSEQQGIQAARD